MGIERFSYRNSGNRTIGFCEIYICEVEGRIKVIVTELPDNPGMSICNAFEDLFVQVCEFYDLPPDKVDWMEHWPAWTAAEGGYDRPKEEYCKVEFDLENNRATNPRWIHITPVVVE
ncbi:hypothetical protein [Laspinema olomoucense]|uniref:hypothetical protein n=1 Tax=Laspinema olomoucense TaxID=3231600 RepID=UPI0021BA7F0F|nr:hypothetical protein [Laspinema sp. D3d]MCT7975250.1 hypothetical protein [Laspinema sp. D3d]